MYAMAVSIALDGDLGIADELQAIHSHVWPYYPVSNRVTEAGHLAFDQSLGTPLLYVPFIWLAHGVVLLANFLGAEIPADGFAPPYFFAVNAASCFMAVGACLCLIRLLRGRVPNGIAFRATAAAIVGSPLLHYGWIAPVNSHVPSAFLIGLFLVVLDRCWRTGEIRWGLLGLLGGLAVSVRVECAVFGLLLIPLVARQEASPARTLLGLLVGGLGFLLALVPEMIKNRILTGTGNPHVQFAGDFFGESFPASWWAGAAMVLFSPFMGLLVWSPVILSTGFGLREGFRRVPWLSIAVGGAFLLQVYVVGSGLRGGIGFGARHFLDFFVPFGVGLGLWLSGGGRRWWPIVWLLACFPLLLLPRGQEVYVRYGEIAAAAAQGAASPVGFGVLLIFLAGWMGIPAGLASRLRGSLDRRSILLPTGLCLAAFVFRGWLRPALVSTAAGGMGTDGAFARNWMGGGGSLGGWISEGMLLVVFAAGVPLLARRWIPCKRPAWVLTAVLVSGSAVVAFAGWKTRPLVEEQVDGDFPIVTDQARLIEQFQGSLRWAVSFEGMGLHGHAERFARRAVRFHPEGTGSGIEGWRGRLTPRLRRVIEEEAARISPERDWVSLIDRYLTGREGPVVTVPFARYREVAARFAALEEEGSPAAREAVRGDLLALRGFYRLAVRHWHTAREKGDTDPARSALLDALPLVELLGPMPAVGP